MAHRATDASPQGVDSVDGDTPPTVGTDGVPDRCLSLTVTSDWGHFRRVDRTVTKQTYRLPPRTTVAGMLAAIAGVHRDGYYDIFARETSAVAIEPVGELRTVTEPSLGLGTHPGESMTRAGGTGRRTVQVLYPDSTEPRQLHSYEYLVGPSFRIDVAVEDADFYTALKRHLQRGTSYYPPSMGLSELLAWVDYHGEFEVEVLDPDGTITIDSAVPDAIDETVPQPGKGYTIEQVPGFMEATEEGRKPAGYIDFAFASDPDETVEVLPESIAPVEVDGRTVIFS